jgi:hypothetical protein
MLLIFLEIVLYWIAMAITIWGVMLTGLGFANLCAFVVDLLTNLVLPKSG